MTIAKLQMMRRLLLQIVAIIEKELCERGAMTNVHSREIQHW